VKAKREGAMDGNREKIATEINYNEKIKRRN